MRATQLIPIFLLAAAAGVESFEARRLRRNGLQGFSSHAAL